MQRANGSPEVLRCVLPNKVEVEVFVPKAWPEEPRQRVQLLDMQGPRASQDFAPLLGRLRQELEQAYSGAVAGGVVAATRRMQLQNCNLREFLDWVYSNVVTEFGSATS
jgi:hypothetical protein